MTVDRAGPGKGPWSVFVNPPGPKRLYRSMVCTFHSKANYVWQPQDFINLSARIPPDHRLWHADCVQERWTTGAFLEALEGREIALLVVAVSSLTLESDLDFVREVRRRHPGSPCLLMGNVFLEKDFRGAGLEAADGIILNSFDADLDEFVRTGSSTGPNIIVGSSGLRAVPETPPREAPREVRLGSPRHEHFLDRRYRFPFVRGLPYGTVSTQFGCAFRCAYCSWSGIPVHYREAREVLAELEGLRALGVKDIFFGDPTFGTPRDNARRLLEGMIERDLGLRWVCYTHPAIHDSESLGLMKRAGCHTVIFGIDSLDMDLLTKSYERPMTRATLENFAAACREAGIAMCGDYIIGWEATRESVDGMVEFAARIGLDYASFNILSPLFGSRYRRDLVRSRSLDSRDAAWDTSGETGEASPELLRLRDRAVRGFYFRPAYLLGRAAKLRTLGELRIQLGEMAGLCRNLIASSLRLARAGVPPARAELRVKDSRKPPPLRGRVDVRRAPGSGRRSPRGCKGKLSIEGSPGGSGSGA